MYLFDALKAMGPAERAKAVKAVSEFHWRYPIAKEAEYGRMLSDYLVASVNDTIKLSVQTLIFRQDGPEEYEPDLSAIIAFGNTVSDFTVGQWAALMQMGVGIAYDAANPAVRATVESWARTQVTLITKADDDMRQKVWNRVTAGVKNGWLNETIRDTIMEDMPGITERRAKLIARDQVSKLRAMLSRQCMEEAGFQTYVWSTAGDERVRPSHSSMEGKVCRWDDETACMGVNGWEPRPGDAVMLHPGMDIQCRCVAAVNDAEMDELDAAEE